jgi:hypothetical protein
MGSFAIGGADGISNIPNSGIHRQVRYSVRMHHRKKMLWRTGRKEGVVVVSRTRNPHRGTVAQSGVSLRCTGAKRRRGRVSTDDSYTEEKKGRLSFSELSIEA